MFSLKPGIHFDEVEFAVFVEELDSASAAIAHVRHRLAHDFAHASALFGGDDGRGRFLKHLLVAALQRTVALAQVNGIALAIAEDLKFRSEEHTSELQSLMRISYAVFCLKN